MLSRKTLRLLAAFLTPYLISSCSFLQEKVGIYNGYSVRPLIKNVSDYMQETNATTKNKYTKDEAINQVMMDSIKSCTDHMKSIYGNEAAFNISTGSLATFTSGWASIASGAQASTLAAISTFTNAERSLVNETVYKNLLTTAIATKISETRETKGNALRKNLSSSNYSSLQADYDLLDYHESCSFYKGLELALKEGTQNTNAQKLSQLEVKSQNLQTKIQLYSDKHKISITEPDKITDPILKNMVTDFVNTAKQISDLTSK